MRSNLIDNNEVQSYFDQHLAKYEIKSFTNE